MTQLARPDPARTSPRRSRHPVPRWTVVSAGLAPILATGGWLVAGAVQPASYSPVRQTVSVLAGQAGTDRWIMTWALFLVGVCQLVTAAGLAAVRVPARILLVVAGLSSIGIAVNPEPARGSTPQHLAWTSLGAAAITVWPAFVARRTFLLILSGYGCAVVTVLFLVLLGWLVIETQGGSDLGLAERLMFSTDTCWPFAVAIALRRAGAGLASLNPIPDFGGDTVCAEAYIAKHMRSGVGYVDESLFSWCRTVEWAELL